MWPAISHLLDQRLMHPWRLEVPSPSSILSSLPFEDSTSSNGCTCWEILTMIMESVSPGVTNELSTIT